MSSASLQITPFSPDFMPFSSFAMRCRDSYRYMIDDEGRKILSRIVALASANQFVLSRSETLHRTQLGCKYERPIGAFHFGESPFDEQRMLPLRDRAREGRLNPKGIPYLYLADNAETAVAEARPSTEQRITLGEFRPVRELRIAAFGSKDWRPDAESPITQNLAELVASSFSRPVQNSDDQSEYAVTQLIAESLKDAGFCGVYYPSSVSNGGNYALFDLDSVQMIQAKVVVVSRVTYEFDDA
jgi:RES domain-containing protein